MSTVFTALPHHVFGRRTRFRNTAGTARTARNRPSGCRDNRRFPAQWFEKPALTSTPSADAPFSPGFRTQSNTCPDRLAEHRRRSVTVRLSQESNDGEHRNTGFRETRVHLRRRHAVLPPPQTIFSHWARKNSRPQRSSDGNSWGLTNRRTSSRACFQSVASIRLCSC